MPGILSVGRLLGGSILGGATAFSPLSLFAANEPGGWYDPSDLTTLYQDSAGTTPVTAVEQPVGLVLDKSKGLVLGSELVTNGDFSNGTTGWESGTSNQTLTVVSGEAKSETTGASGRPLLYRPIAFATTDVLYKVEFDVYSPNYSGSINVSLNDSLGPDAYSFRPSVTATRTRISSYLRAGPTPKFYISATGTIPTGTIVYFDNVSVKQVQGSHLSQSTAAARPVLSARVNLLTYTEQFDNAAWAKFETIVSANATTDPLGGNTADKLVETAVNNVHYASQNGVYTAGVTYTISCCAKAAERSFLYLRLGNTAVFGAETAAYFDLSAGTVGTVLNSATCTITSLGNGWYRCSVTKAATATGTVAVVGPYVAQSDGTSSYLGDNTKGIYIWGADLRPANAGVGLPAYQRVGAATSGSSTAAGNADYDSGPEWPRYLRFDGVDDFLQSSTITPGADKAQVFAGVRKLSDVAAGVVAEMSSTSASTDGTLALFAPSNTSLADYFFRSRGTVAVGVTSPTNYAAPITNVLSGLADISGDSVIVRANGGQVASSTSDQGSGNYTSQVMYVGSRAGTSNRFSGQLYSLLVRFSASNLDAATITATETWVNSKTRAF